MTDLAHRWADSYRVRLAVGYLLVVALFAAGWGWSLFGPLTAATVEQQQATLRAVAQAGVLVLAEPDADAQESVDRLVARTNLRMTVVAADGTVIADSEEAPSAMENHAGRPEIASALAGETGSDRRVSATQGTEQIYVAVPAGLDGQRVALRVSESLERINAVAASSRRIGLFLLAAAVLAAGIIVVRLTGVASEPIVRLSGAAKSMAAGNLDAPVPVEQGDLSVLSGALLDLREQMKLRLSDLEAEERNLRAVLDGLADAVFLLHDREVRFANRAASPLFKAPSGGWRGRDLAQLRLPASVVAAIEAGMDAEEAPLVTECGPDPRGRYLRVTVLPLNPTDQFARTLVVIADVTERVRIDAVRRDFVANASHELKTPTAAIHLLAESAATAAGDGDSDQAVEFARQISAESARLSRLVSDLLDLSRLESAPAPGSIADVREAISNAVVSHRIAASQRGLELRYDDARAEGVDAYVVADPTDLAVALDNLLDNAIKYTEAGSVTVGLAAEDESVSIEVRDTGIGIPAEDLPRVFERFYRVDRARSRDSGGTGLGLSLVRHVVDRSDGTVEVSSAVGEGTTFTITLRRATGRS